MNVFTIWLRIVQIGVSPAKDIGESRWLFFIVPPVATL